MGLYFGSFKDKGSIASNAMAAFTQKFIICICFFLLINQLTVSEAGQRSIDACDGKAAGDNCTKPACEEDNPPRWCKCKGPRDPYPFCKRLEQCTCKDISGTLYCKRPQ